MFSTFGKRACVRGVLGAALLQAGEGFGVDVSTVVDFFVGSWLAWGMS